MKLGTILVRVVGIHAMRKSLAIAPPIAGQLPREEVSWLETIATLRYRPR
jgi:hypothetical protein